MDEYSICVDGQWHRFGIVQSRYNGVKVILLDNGREYYGQARDITDARKQLRKHFAALQLLRAPYGALSGDVKREGQR